MKLSILYPKFWAVFRSADAIRSDLFSSSRIGPVNYIARPAKITGANFVASLDRMGGMVQCEVMFNTRKADRKSLIKLADHIERDKNQILGFLGSHYKIEKADHAIAVRRMLTDAGNILNEGSWEQLAEALVLEITRLYEVMNPFIEQALSEIYEEKIFKLERRSDSEQIMLPT